MKSNIIVMIIALFSFNGCKKNILERPRNTRFPQANNLPANKSHFNKAKGNHSLKQELTDWIDDDSSSLISWQNYKLNLQATASTKVLYTLGQYPSALQIEQQYVGPLKNWGLVDKYNFLSNYYIHHPALVIERKSYKSVEHYFQCSKFIEAGKCCEEIQRKATGLDAYKAGLQLQKSIRCQKEIRNIYKKSPSKWKKRALQTMKKALAYKFTNELTSVNRLGRDLIKTAPFELINGMKLGSSTPTDTFWGVELDFPKQIFNGFNALGELLEDLRQILDEFD